MTGWAPTRSRHSSDVASDRHKANPFLTDPDITSTSGSDVTGQQFVIVVEHPPSLLSWRRKNDHSAGWSSNWVSHCCVALAECLLCLPRLDHVWSVLLRCCCATVYMTTCNYRKNPFCRIVLQYQTSGLSTFSFWMPAACVQFCGLARMTADARHGCWWQRCAISQAICHLCLLWPNHRHLVSLIDPLLDLFQA